MKKDRFQEITRRYSSLRMALVGDFSLDRYLEIDPEKPETSIETGLPVHNVIRVRGQPGSSGTILNNLVALGIHTLWPVGFCGRDGEGYELQHALKARGPSVHLDHFFATQSRRTFTYCKPLLMHKDRPPEELSRLDSKNWTPTPSEVEERICASLESLADRVDVIIVLDQVDASGTGVVTPRVLETVNQIAMARPDLWMIADSRQGLAGWPALIYKMNARELGSMLQQSPPEDPREAGVMAGQLARTTGRHVFVTLAEKGIVGASPDGAVEAAPSLPLRGPIDIVGAGDSVTANLAAALAAGSTLRESLQLANTAASLVIHQLGDTGTASVNQMQDLLFGP